MKRLILCLAAIGLMSGSATAQEPKPLPEIVKWYQQHYPFVTMEDSIFTFESEFEFPDGFSRPDSSELTPFQNWMSHFPLWHRWKPVGLWKGTKLYEWDRISRTVHLPWKGDRFKAPTIPLRILGEWLHMHGRESEYRIVPKVGDTMRYEDFLGGELRYNNRMEPFFLESERREPSTREFFRFMLLCLDLTTYSSLVANCDSISSEELAPGDLFIAHDETGRHGVTYMVLVKLVDDNGERRFAVACGCEEACDFHIPLLTEDRHRPWVTVAEIERLALDYPHAGFFRMRLR